MAESTNTKGLAGESVILAQRYAGALYDLAVEQNKTDAIAADLRGLKSLLKESAEFRHVIHHPLLSRFQLMAAMKEVVKAARLAPLTGNFLDLLAKNRRLELLGAVVDAFLVILGAKRGDVWAEIRVAKPLTSAQHEQLAAQLKKLAGHEVSMTITEDKNLLGGLVVQLGSCRIDASIRGKLMQMQRTLQEESSTWHNVVAV